MAITTTPRITAPLCDPDRTHVYDEIAARGGPMLVFVSAPLMRAKEAARRATDHLAAGQRQKAVRELRQMERMIDEALGNTKPLARSGRRMARALRRESPMTGWMMPDLVRMWIGADA